MFPDDWKCGVVLPLPNKAGLELLYKKCKTVTSLQYQSKLKERVVFHQIHLHMKENDIYPVMQSSYRQHHSTELKVMKDILLLRPSELPTCNYLVLLDLSAAFDTVDHQILWTLLSKDNDDGYENAT